MTLFTVVGGEGFIGSEIVTLLEKRGHKVYIPERSGDEHLYKSLGVVIYCAGHGDCARNSLKVLDSNVTELSRIVERAEFEKIVYLSSNRVYMDQYESTENSSLTISSSDSRRLFNLTKLVAEEILLKSNRNCTILRLSNVYGVALSSPLFLPAITKNAIQNGKVDMYVLPEYEKDYVAVSDVADITVRAAVMDKTINEIYNVASGVNVSAFDIAEILKGETGCEIDWHSNGVTEQFPVTDISLIKKDFDFNPRNVLLDLRNMIDMFKAELLGLN